MEPGRWESTFRSACLAPLGEALNVTVRPEKTISGDTGPFIVVEGTMLHMKGGVEVEVVCKGVNVGALGDGAMASERLRAQRTAHLLREGLMWKTASARKFPCVSLLGHYTDESGRLWLISERMEGSLEELIHSSKHASEDESESEHGSELLSNGEKWALCACLTLAVCEMEQVGVIHGNLTPSSVLYYSTGGPGEKRSLTFKVGGFGFARPADLSLQSPTFQRIWAGYECDFVHLSLGKKLPLQWLSPERLRSGESTRRSDWWTLGLMLWSAFTLREPFEEWSDRMIEERIGGEVMGPYEALSLSQSLAHEKQRNCVKSVLKQWEGKRKLHAYQYTEVLREVTGAAEAVAKGEAAAKRRAGQPLTAAAAAKARALASAQKRNYETDADRYHHASAAQRRREALTRGVNQGGGRSRAPQRAFTRAHTPPNMFSSARVSPVPSVRAQPLSRSQPTHQRAHTPPGGQKRGRRDSEERRGSEGNGKDDGNCTDPTEKDRKESGDTPEQKEVSAAEVETQQELKETESEERTAAKDETGTGEEKTRQSSPSAREIAQSKRYANVAAKGTSKKKRKRKAALGKNAAAPIVAKEGRDDFNASIDDGVTGAEEEGTGKDFGKGESVSGQESQREREREKEKERESATEDLAKNANEKEREAGLHGKEEPETSETERETDSDREKGRMSKGGVKGDMGSERVEKRKEKKTEKCQKAERGKEERKKEKGKGKAKGNGQGKGKGKGKKTKASKASPPPTERQSEKGKEIESEEESAGSGEVKGRAAAEKEESAANQKKPDVEAVVSAFVDFIDLAVQCAQ